MNTNQSKAELEKQIRIKNLKSLNTANALSDLVIYNLENFAYRYLETKTSKDIKCQFKDNTYWVESIEEDILVALKWNNLTLKKYLIDLCKKYPGKESKNIKIKLKLGSEITGENEISCFSLVSWNFPDFKESQNQIKEVVKFKFEDLLELRNKHAALLEKAARIF